MNRGSKSSYSLTEKVEEILGGGLDFSALKASGIKGTYSHSGSPPGFGYRAAGLDVFIILYGSGFLMVSPYSFRLLEAHIGQ